MASGGDGGGRGLLRMVLIVAVIAAAAGGVWWLDPVGLSADQSLRDALVRRGRIAVHGDGGLLGLAAEGGRLLSPSQVPQVAAALAAERPADLLAAMRAVDVDAVLVEAQAGAAEGTLAGRFASYGAVDGFRGLHLSPRAALYAPDPAAELSETHRAALARVARGLLRGARPPRITSFPEPLRRLRPVEVMVLIRQGPRPRLWRSARGNSIARALNTAAVVARKRWFERQQAMGGPIDELLPRMKIEVALLADDGTIGSVEPAFVDRVFGETHGVAYERKGAWRYLLPDATRAEGKGRASVAYRKLLSDDGLPPDRLGSRELRLYRRLVDTIAVSEPEPPPRDGLSPVGSPDEVLGGADAGAAERAAAKLPREGRPREAAPDDGLSEVRSPDEVLAP